MFLAMSTSCLKASGQSQAQPNDDYATSDERESVILISKSLCASERPPSSTSLTTEARMYKDLLRGNKSAQQVLEITNHALTSALNQMGSGDWTESRALLCIVLDARS